MATRPPKRTSRKLRVPPVAREPSNPITGAAAADRPERVQVTEEHRRRAAADFAAENEGIEIPSYLPMPVQSIARLGERLYQAALAPFPDLVSKPSSRQDVVRRVRHAVRWARRIRRLCTGDDGTPHAYTLDSLQYRLTPLHIRDTSVSFARELLGSPPEMVAKACNTERLIECEPPRGRALKAWASDHRVRWVQVAIDFQHRHLSTRIQALTLVTWIRERTDVIRNAMLPRIDLDKIGTRHWIATIDMAGASKQVTLPNAQGLALCEMVTLGATTADRSAIRGGGKRALCSLIPELAPHVDSVGGVPRHSAKGRYALAPAMKGRIRMVNEKLGRS